MEKRESRPTPKGGTEQVYIVFTKPNLSVEYIFVFRNYCGEEGE